jgi:hypothetical protein
MTKRRKKPKRKPVKRKKPARKPVWKFRLPGAT